MFVMYRDRIGVFIRRTLI